MFKEAFAVAAVVLVVFVVDNILVAGGTVSSSLEPTGALVVVVTAVTAVAGVVTVAKGIVAVSTVVAIEGRTVMVADGTFVRVPVPASCTSALVVVLMFEPLPSLLESVIM